MSKYPRNTEGGLALSISVVAACMLMLPALGIERMWIVACGMALGAAILGWAIARRLYPLIHLSLFFVLLFSWRYSPFWPRDLPTGLVAPFLSYLLVVLLVPSLRRSITWFKRGSLTGQPLWAALLILALSLPALLLWALYSENVIEYYVYLFHPRILYIELIIFAVLFATINAVTQEVIFRGVYQDALGIAFGSEKYALPVQALIFGLIHSVGVPSGLPGIAMAFCYGYALGILKRMAGGLLLPVAVHFVTDLFIFFLVFYKAWLLDLLGVFPLL